MGLPARFIKKDGKPTDNPNSYRKITVTNPIGKLIGKLHLCRNTQNICKTQSALQKGFTRGESPTIAALIMTELFTEAIENNKSIFIALTDAQKAFDIVWHDGLFREIFKANITGSNWLLFKEWYNNMQTKIKWQGQHSRTLHESKESVHQGGVWYPAAYKIFINSLLATYETEKLGARIGSIFCGVPTVADDVTLVLFDPFELQTMLDTQMSHENKLRYIISTQKSCVLQCNSKENHTWNIGQNLEPADTATHLVIKRDNKSITGTKEVVADRIQIARRTVYALMGAGLHGLSGLNPRASIPLINCYGIPRLLYGLDVIQLYAIDVKNLNVYFNKLIKQIQHLPERTANAGALLLLGQIPIEGQIHKRMLCTFRNVIANTNSVEQNIGYRQLATKSNDLKSWFINIVQITQIYDLPSPYDLMETPPNKRKWKKLVTDSVNLYWTLKLKDEINFKTTLKYLNVDDILMIGKTHNIWYSGGAEPYAV